MLKAYQQRQHLPVEQAQGNPILSTLGTVAGTAAGAAIGPAGAAIGGALGSQLGNVASGAPIDPAQMAMSGLTSGMSQGSQAASEAAKGLEAAKQSVVTAAAKGTETDAYKQAIKSLQEAGVTSMEANDSMLNDPFGKAVNAAKSVFMAEGGEVYKSPLEKFSSMKSGDRDKMLMMGALPLIMQNPKMFGGLGTMFLNKGGEVYKSPLEAFKNMKSGDRDRLLMMGALPLIMQNGSMVGGLGSMFLNKGGEVKPQETNKSKLKRDKDGKLILPDNIDFSKLQSMSEAEKRQRAALDQQTRSVAYKAQGGPLCSKCEAEYKACGGMTKKRY